MKQQHVSPGQEFSRQQESSVISLTWPLKSLPWTRSDVLPCKISTGVLFQIFIWSCNKLLELNQEWAEYFMSTRHQALEHFFNSYAEILILITDELDLSGAKQHIIFVISRGHGEAIAGKCRMETKLKWASSAEGKLPNIAKILNSPVFMITEEISPKISRVSFKNDTGICGELQELWGLYWSVQTSGMKEEYITWVLSLCPWIYSARNFHPRVTCRTYKHHPVFGQNSGIAYWKLTIYGREDTAKL